MAEKTKNRSKAEVLSEVEGSKSKITNPLHVIDCGLADYRQVLERQHQLCKKRQQGKIPNTVLIVEHPPVITLGARQSANKLLTDRSTLAQQNIDVIESRRGGGTTAHNPGQLVFYPILHLSDLGLGISEYIRELEQIGIELLEQLGINSQTQKGLPGLWAGDRKIASIGVRVSKSVTYHGMAINIQNDLSIFDLFIPCGLNGVEITSVLKETGKKHSINQIKQKLSNLLTKHFSREHICSSQLVHNTQYAIRNTTQARKLPAWLKRPLPAGDNYKHTEKILTSLGLETICANANCPNQGECWDRAAAAVLILGNICTRNCKFCSLTPGRPKPPDPTEPARLAEMAERTGTKYLVITSVNRDDLPDGGAGHFRDCINRVRQQCPDIKFEILTPDFRDCQADALKTLADALPFVFAHNLETVPSLYPLARPGGNYQRSLNLLKMAKEAYPAPILRIDHRMVSNTVCKPKHSYCSTVNSQNRCGATKSSIMLGLGETDAEVEQGLKDLRDVGCDRITIGQYLKPSKDSLEVVEYITPAKFEWWKQKAIQLGFSWVFSAPFARSSYFAEKENTL